MKKFLILLPLFLYSSEDFISDYEYGEMLYNNPRGIGCAECHGDDGAGTTIVEYIDDDNKTKTINSPDLHKESLSSIINSVNRSHEIMPRYYLTRKEVRAIFEYLQEQRTKDNKVKKIIKSKSPEVK